MIPRGPAYSWRKALLLIFFSTLFSLSLFGFLQTRGDRPVVAIIQEAHGEKLPTQCLAELLGLSVDQPLSFAHFPVKEAERRLLDYLFFKSVSIKKIRPNILYIDYELRRPIARFADQSNRGVDAEGVCFPLEPFYCLGELPTVYYNDSAKHHMLKLLELPVKLIDLSKVEAPTLGSREIVVQLEDERWLRFPVHQLESALAHFQKRPLEGRIIDLRIPNTAYIYE